MESILFKASKLLSSCFIVTLSLVDALLIATFNSLATCTPSSNNSPPFCIKFPISFSLRIKSDGLNMISGLKIPSSPITSILNSWSKPSKFFRASCLNPNSLGSPIFAAVSYTHLTLPTKRIV